MTSRFLYAHTSYTHFLVVHIVIVKIFIRKENILLHIHSIKTILLLFLNVSNNKRKMFLSCLLCADQLETSILSPPPPTPGKVQAFELLKIGSFKFPPPPAKIVLKCPTQSSNLSVRCRCRFQSSLMKLVYKHVNVCLVTLYMMMPFTKTQLNIETIKNYSKLSQLQKVRQCQ